MPLEPLSRRSVVRGVLVSGCAAIAGFVAGRSRAADAGDAPTAANAYGPAAPADRFLARTDDLEADGGLVLTEARIVLTRAADGTVRGFSATCTHQGCPVGSVAAGVISCPCHASRFDAESGSVISGPATRALPSVPVVVRDGGVYTS
jgi:Rieske Fe-S protein